MRAPAYAWCVLWLAVLAGCRAPDLYDACPDAETVRTCPALCPQCLHDEDCTFGGNPCVGEFVCAHRDVELSFPSLGCSEALEVERPDDDGCRCIDGYCRMPAERP